MRQCAIQLRPNVQENNDQSFQADGRKCQLDKMPRVFLQSWKGKYLLITDRLSLLMSAAGLSVSAGR